MTGATMLVLATCRLLRAEQQNLPPVVVTAPPVGTDRQRVPASVTALFEDEMVAAGIEGTQDLGTYAPNLVVREGGDRKLSFLSMRGIPNAILGQPAVGLYIDGVPYSDVRASLFDLLDVAHVDVFHGPQLFRFGRMGEAGAISIVTRRPASAFGAYGSIVYGSSNTQIYRGAVDVPLGAQTLLSFAGFESKRDGYIRNVFRHQPLDDRAAFGGRARLSLLPTPALQVDLTAEVHHADDAGNAFILLDQPDPFRVAYDNPGRAVTDDDVGALRVAWDAGGVRVSSISAVRVLNATRGAFDGDFTPRDLVVVESNRRFLDATQELRLTSPRRGGRWRWQVGGFFESKSTEDPLTGRFDSTPLVRAPPPVGLGLPFSAPVSDRQLGRFRDLTAAGFGETTVRLPWRLRFTLGLRYEYFQETLDRTHLLIPPSKPKTRSVVPPFHGHTSSSAWLPSATLAYRPRAPLMLYTTVARGYRPGGFSHLTDDFAEARFDPQFETSAEVGVKGSALQRTLHASLAFFYIRGRDFQDQRRMGFSSFVIRADGRPRSGRRPLRPLPVPHRPALRRQRDRARPPLRCPARRAVPPPVRGLRARRVAGHRHLSVPAEQLPPPGPVPSRRSPHRVGGTPRRGRAVRDQPDRHDLFPGGVPRRRRGLVHRDARGPARHWHARIGAVLDFHDAGSCRGYTEGRTYGNRTSAMRRRGCPCEDGRGVCPTRGRDGPDHARGPDVWDHHRCPGADERAARPQHPRAQE